MPRDKRKRGDDVLNAAAVSALISVKISSTAPHLFRRGGRVEAIVSELRQHFSSFHLKCVRPKHVMARYAPLRNTTA